MTGPGSIDAYLRCLAALGVGAPADQARLLAEVDDHLREAADEAIASGMPAAEAEGVAIERFGSAAVVADRARLAGVVVKGRDRLRRAIRVNVVAGIVVIAAMVALAAADLQPLVLGLAAFEVTFVLVVLAAYLRIARWGLQPQSVLEAAFHREALGWLRLVQTVRIQMLALVLFVAFWGPAKLWTDRHLYEAQPWRAVVGFGGIIIICVLVWQRTRRNRTRAEHEVDQAVRLMHRV